MSHCSYLLLLCAQFDAPSLYKFSTLCVMECAITYTPVHMVSEMECTSTMVYCCW